jgi:hypothetical protein
VDKDIETLATGLYVKIDDMLAAWPDLVPARPVTGTPLTLSDAELLTMSVMSALLGFRSERRWLRYVNAHLAGMFPRRIGQSGYNKRLRKAFTLFIRVMLRPVRKGEAKRAGQQLLKPLRQVVESVNWTLKGQLDLEQHGGRTPEGILVRVLARILALTAAIWHNDKTSQDVKRSLVAYDH